MWFGGRAVPNKPTKSLISKPGDGVVCYRPTYGKIFRIHK